MLLVLGFFKGMELKHSIGLGGGRSRGDLASSDKKAGIRGQKYSKTKGTSAFQSKPGSLPSFVSGKVCLQSWSG